MFKDYKSKPIVRKAHQLVEGDSFDLSSEGANLYPVEVGGSNYEFYAAEEPVVGGWVVYLDYDDIYYCSDKVFRERNIVE